MAAAQVRADLLVTLNEPDRRRHQVAEIEAFALLLDRFVVSVDLRHFLALLRGLLLLRSLGGREHVIGKLGVAPGGNHLVLGARDRGKDVADLE
jgi:hypothetical protein